MTFSNFFFFLSFSLLLLSRLWASDVAIDPAKPALLPRPQVLEWKESAIQLSSVNVELPSLKSASLQGQQLKKELRALLDENGIAVASEASSKIVFRLGEVKVPGHWKGQDAEAYRLSSGERGILVEANQLLGLYRGMQTLRQLVVKHEGRVTIAACEIRDYPAFKIRGVMHDVGRNFQTLPQLKRQIDVMAKCKMNIFHWHLTEYHGWRLQSRKYPSLQEDKAFSRYVGSFYTQEEFREFSDYCWARGMTIIPEFDSPGHSEAFRKGLGLKNMKDPKALEAMVGLIDELCGLADKERMPYIHVGTDEVRHAAEQVGPDYLPALHAAIHRNGREVIGWVKGMTIKGDAKQIQQTWASSRPIAGMRHIDSRSNYVNHLEALDFAARLYFQQPCRVPHGDELNLGGILAHWPDMLVEDQAKTLTNNPVIPAIVAYSEAVWKGVKQDKPDYWAKLPAVGTEEFEAFADFEDRIAELRDRFFTDVPFPMVKTHEIEWRLLGPVDATEVPELDQAIIKDIYEPDGRVYRWTKPLRGGAIHIKHFFGFPGHLKSFAKGKDVVWGNSYVYSPIDQVVGAWIGFNTFSTSDDRSGAASEGNWSANPDCKIWINGEAIAAPEWINPGKSGKEHALTNEIYSSRKPTPIRLKKGWNSVLVKAGYRWKWVFSFSPVMPQGESYREIPGLKYSAQNPEK